MTAHEQFVDRFGRHLFVILFLFLSEILIGGQDLENAPAAKSGAIKIDPSEWPAYARDAGGSRYSPLDQIRRDNVRQLKIAWTYRTGASEIKARSANKAAFEATPIFIDGALYLSTPYNRVIALNPKTGKELWAYDPQVPLDRNYSEVTSRGVSTWPAPGGVPEKSRPRRIYVATIDARLIALDAAAGKPCEDFGEHGIVDLTHDLRIVDRGDYEVTSPPAVIGDLIIVGSSIGDNRGAELERGVVRAYDALTGKLRWSWDPIPLDPQDPARKTWRDESAEKAGAANAWSIISVDSERDLVFIPTGSPSPDYYGGQRKGENRYANSVVALRASTGKVVWHFQVVHHDLWDYDVAAQPMLINVKRNGRDVPAVAVGTKMGLIFLFDRRDGTPLFPIVERRVPQSTVAGEQTSPTQPFPSLPRPLVPHRISANDAWGLTDQDRNTCRAWIKSLRHEGIYTPPSLEGTITMPGIYGGMNWSGMSFDPSRNLLFTNTNNLPIVVKLIPRDEYQKMLEPGAMPRMRGGFGRQSGTPYVVHREPLHSPNGFPCINPPWGTLAAVDLISGRVRWQVPLGRIPHLGEAGEKAANWGSLNLGGSFVTAGGIVFIAAAEDDRLRAFDVESGKEIWAAELPASAQAAPMTYAIDGKQYLVIAAGGHGKISTKRGDYVVAFSLP